MSDGKATEKKKSEPFGGDVKLASADDRGVPTVRVTERSIWDSQGERPTGKRPRYDMVTQPIETNGATEVRGRGTRSTVQVSTEIQLNGAVLGRQDDSLEAREYIPWCWDPNRNRPRY